MENHKIGYANAWEFYPDHGSEDWYEVLRQKLQEDGEPFPKAMWYQDAEDPSRNFQLTQMNTFIFLNRADEVHDLVEIITPHGKVYSWFREDISGDGFDQLLQALQDNYCATVVLSMMPGVGVVEKFDSQALADLNAGFLPESWSDGEG